MANKLSIYNASAGSGKTYTLVREYLRLLFKADKDPRKFTKILAMTFTNKAANEMKERIVSALQTLSVPEHERTAKQQKFLDDKVKELEIPAKKIEELAPRILNSILHNYGAFSIMTIDKFTHRVIRTFARDLNISLDFDVQVDLAPLRRSITELLFDSIGRDENVTKLMVHYANSNLNEDKSWDFTESLFKFTKEIFREDALKAVKKLGELNSVDFIAIRKNIIASRTKFENDVREVAKEAVDLCVASGINEDDFHSKSSGILANLKKMAGDKGDLKNYQWGSAARKGFESGDWIHPQSPNRAAIERIMPQLSSLTDVLTELFGEPLEQYILQVEILKNFNNLSLTRHLTKLIDEIKEEENTLLISDFYQTIAEIISREPVPFIYERLGVRYEHFLLDEFQDTSQLQWMNLVPLLHESLAFGHENLIVGDGKQAIYRWRNGEVEQFVNLPDQVFNPDQIPSLKEAESKFKEEGIRHNLKKNFRSAPLIIDFNNRLFRDAASQESNLIQKIYKELEQDPVLEHQGYIELKTADKLDEEEQLSYTLGVIQQCLVNGYKYSDIAVLIRGNKTAATVAGFLSDSGIPCLSPDSLYIGKNNLVRLVFHIFSAQIYPRQLNHVVKAFELFVRTILKAEPSSKAAELNLDLSSAGLYEAFDLLGLKIPEKQQHSIYESLLDIIRRIQDFIGAEQNLSDDPYLTGFLENAHSYEKQRNNNKRDFIKWFLDEGYKKSVSNPEGANAVRIMTVHKAKGLQFPVVISPFCDWKLEPHKTELWIDRTYDDIPVYFLGMVENLERSAIKDIYEEEIGKVKMDNLNLLYVALTRAETALFISGGGKTEKSVMGRWIRPFIKRSGLNFTEENGISRLGEFLSNENTEEQTEARFELKCSLFTDNGPEISYRREYPVKHDEGEQLRSFGTAVHLVLSRLNRPEELQSILEKAIIKGEIDAEFEARILSQISSLMNNERFKSYFCGDQIFNEQKIISKKGKVKIPDRIIVNADELMVVDFKTGLQQQIHIEQVLEYVNLLKEAGYRNVKGELFYTESGEYVVV